MTTVERIEYLIKQKEINDKTFLNDLGFSKNALNEWRSGVTKSYMSKIDAIADYFSVSTDYLLGRTDNPAPAGEVFALSSDTPYDELPPEALEEIENFKQYVLQKYKKKD